MYFGHSWFVQALHHRKIEYLHLLLRLLSRTLLIHCATSRKVAGSIPDGVTGIFHLLPSCRTMALGSTQPLKEMSISNISWGHKCGQCLELITLQTLMCQLFQTMGASTCWYPMGLSRVCFTLHMLLIISTNLTEVFLPWLRFIYPDYTLTEVFSSLTEVYLPWQRSFYPDWGFPTLTEVFSTLTEVSLPWRRFFLPWLRFFLPWLRFFYPDWGFPTLTEVFLPWLRFFYPAWGFPTLTEIFLPW